MKAKLNPAGKLKDWLAKVLNISLLRSGPGIASLAVCAVTVIATVSTMSGVAVSDIRDFETGKVADRDVIAVYSFSYVDEDATKARVEAQRRLVPAVFRYSAVSDTAVLDSWNSFCDFTDNLANNGSSVAAARLATQAEYPAWFSNETLNAYFAALDRAQFRGYGIEALNAMLKQGIFAVNREELHDYNPDMAEIMDVSFPASERKLIYYNEIVTDAGVREALGEIVKNAQFPVAFKAVAVDILGRFIKENVFFSSLDTQKRVIEATERPTPVFRNIERGKRIIRKGFIISEDEMRELRAFYAAYPGRDPRNVVGLVLLVLLINILFALLRSRLILGRELNDRERYLFSAIVCVYLIGPMLIKNLSPGFEGFPVSLAFPAALLVMILAVFLSSRAALIMAIALPLGAFLVGAFDNPSYIIALISGVAAYAALHGAQKRMDLVKTGLAIAVANCLAVIIILLIRRAGIEDYAGMLFWAALNGIISGMLILGFLPPLEQALNAVTPFRLLELSDLNAPILRKLFTAAPGTYGHSIMVANLAEQACQDIGANPLLARVGAYYHDIGKMDNPGYFVENQTDYNRHDDIAPRLSVTVIRSHVKLGIEKARSLGLPDAVINIIAEHHGNSIISWFYNKALEQEEQVKAEDFSYPGNPPHSKESAVVMLADITEAAVRTLNKPTAAKIEKFVQQLFETKVDHGQLAESDLTFRDLETIKKAFVKVLAGYYHSRIEYPNQKEDGAE